MIYDDDDDRKVFQIQKTTSLPMQQYLRRLDAVIENRHNTPLIVLAAELAGSAHHD